MREQPLLCHPFADQAHARVTLAVPLVFLHRFDLRVFLNKTWGWLVSKRSKKTLCKQSAYQNWFHLNLGKKNTNTNRQCSEKSRSRRRQIIPRNLRDSRGNVSDKLPSTFDRRSSEGIFVYRSNRFLQVDYRGRKENHTHTVHYAQNLKHDRASS